MNRMELPERYIEKMRQLLGDEFSPYLDSFETPSVNGLRVNTGKVDVEHFLEMLIGVYIYVYSKCGFISLLIRLWRSELVTRSLLSVV